MICRIESRSNFIGTSINQPLVKRNLNIQPFGRIRTAEVGALIGPSAAGWKGPEAPYLRYRSALGRNWPKQHQRQAPRLLEIFHPKSRNPPSQNIRIIAIFRPSRCYLHARSLYRYLSTFTALFQQIPARVSCSFRPAIPIKDDLSLPIPRR
jgi:hypothetical protein